MAFPVTKKLELDYLGEGWAGAYINFSGLSFKQARVFEKMTLDTENPENDKNLDLLLETLGEHLLSGKAWNGTELVDLKAEDLSDLPVEVLTKAIGLITAGPDANL